MDELTALPLAEQIVVSNLLFKLAGTYVNDPLDVTSKRYKQAITLSTTNDLAWHAVLPTHACALAHRQVEELVETWKSATATRDCLMAMIVSDFEPEPLHSPEPLRATLTLLSNSVFQKDRDAAMKIHQALWLQLARRFASRTLFFLVFNFCLFFWFVDQCLWYSC